MSSNPIQGPKGPEPSEPSNKKDSPDSKRFKDMMKIEKTKEVELEKQRKRKFQTTQSEKEKSDAAATDSSKTSLPSPYEGYQKAQDSTTSRYQSSPTYDNKEQLEQKKGPTSEQSSLDQKDQEKEKVSDKDNIKDKTTDEEKELAAKASTKKDENLDKIDALPTENKEKIGAYKGPTEKTSSKDEKKVTTKNIYEQPIDKEKVEQDKKGTDKSKDKDENQGRKKKFDEYYQSSSIPQSISDMPKDVAMQTVQMTSVLTSYLHPDVVPLFERTVGTIIQMQMNGVATTEILLNNPAFANSIFYGSTIILERYATAPDSFNIKLTGTDQAVTLFKENIDGLQTAFERGKFDFKIGRLEAFYERPLFKRKEKTGREEKDSGGLK